MILPLVLAKPGASRPRKIPGVCVPLQVKVNAEMAVALAEDTARLQVGDGDAHRVLLAVGHAFLELLERQGVTDLDAVLDVLRRDRVTVRVRK